MGPGSTSLVLATVFEIRYVEQTAGLASVISWLIFGSVVVPAAVDEAVAIIALTVMLSVVCHGFSAMPLARRYGKAHPDSALSTEEVAVRRLTGHR